MEENEEEELLETLRDFTIKKHWDKFLSVRAFDWYAEWPQFRQLLLACLSAITTAEASSSTSPPLPLQILIPLCGSSGLSEHVYDACFRCITNIDFSKVIISEMLRQIVRSRPEMKSRVMDMTDMKFVDETFDVVLHKRGLDALMEPLLGPKFGNHYLAEVKRVLQKGGKYFCFTLSESRVLGIFLNHHTRGLRINRRRNESHASQIDDIHGSVYSSLWKIYESA